MQIQKKTSSHRTRELILCDEVFCLFASKVEEKSMPHPQTCHLDGEHKDSCLITAKRNEASTPTPHIFKLTVRVNSLKLSTSCNDPHKIILESSAIIGMPMGKPDSRSLRLCRRGDYRVGLFIL